MIAEALAWLTTPAPAWARKLGYLRELVAIEARHRRCQSAWAPHLDDTREAIRNAAGRSTRRRQAVIYGSGPLFDIPLRDLAESFDTVTLVDAAHLRRTRRAAEPFANVRFIEADIAGVADALLRDTARKADSLPRPTPPPIADFGAVDLVVSANMLAQLPAAPLNFLSRRSGAPLDAFDEYAREIIQAHLDHLAAFDAVSCLITETESQHIGADGAVMTSHNALRGLTIPSTDRTWDWTVAPLGEVSQTFAVRNRVAAVTRIPQCSDSAAKRRGASP